MPYNLKYFFLALPIERPEYMRKNLKHFPPDIIQQYSLHEKLAKYRYV